MCSSISGTIGFAFANLGLNTNIDFAPDVRIPIRRFSRLVTEAGRLLSVVDMKISYVLILAVKVLTLGSVALRK